MFTKNTQIWWFVIYNHLFSSILLSSILASQTKRSTYIKKSFKNTHHPTVSVWGSAFIKVKVWTSWHVCWKLQGLHWNSMVLILFKVYLLWPGSKTVLYVVFSPGFWDRWWKWHRNLVKYIYISVLCWAEKWLVSKPFAMYTYIFICIFRFYVSFEGG